MKYIWILALCVAPLVFHAQSTVLQSAESESAFSSKVLVVPFHQTRYYFSDCDKNLAGESRLEVPDVRNSFRYGLDYAAESRFEKRYQSLNLVQMRDSLDKAFMDSFYGKVSYSYEKPARLLVPAGKGLMGRVKQAFSQVGSKEKEEELEEVEAYTKVEAIDEQYMALNWNDKNFLDDLVATYSPNYIVTINQFEIKTDYQRCIDRDLGNYTRRIKVHYNVFDAAGNRIAGDVLTAKYNSTTDDVNRIIQDNFGMLADYIMYSLPRN